MKHFQLLSELGRRGTLGAAAEALALTLPAVSKMLREIGLALGARLFERGRRGVEPTELGRAAIRHARTVIGEVGLLADELQVMDRGASALLWKHLAGQPWVAMPRDTVARQRFMEAFVRQGLVPSQSVVETLSPVTVAARVREDPTLIGLARHETARQSELLAGVRRLPIAPRMPLPALCLITRRGAAGATDLLRAFVESVRSVS